MTFNWDTVLIALIQALTTLGTTWLNRGDRPVDKNRKPGRKQANRER
ncbi:MAG TPA: hypothetical protein VK464_25260 [Symbiobacteriaceae bacterium]|nr:hypothetical protein [Symbiobacteriaceae bacterium]